MPPVCNTSCLFKKLYSTVKAWIILVDITYSLRPERLAKYNITFSELLYCSQSCSLKLFIRGVLILTKVSRARHTKVSFQRKLNLLFQKLSFRSLMVIYIIMSASCFDEEGLCAAKNLHSNCLQAQHHIRRQSTCFPYPPAHSFCSFL